MRKYGDENYVTHSFNLRLLGMERRGHWVDVELELKLPDGDELPDGLISPNVLVICVPSGEVIQIVLQDEGCDSEYQFNPAEEEIIRSYIREHCDALIRSI